MSERYKVVKGSESGHCCFDATVIDTQTPHPVYTGEHDWVCECFDMKTAQKIAKVLNVAPTTTEQQPSPDVTALVEALELMVATHDEGGWPTETIAIARDALTTYRKQHEGQS